MVTKLVSLAAAITTIDLAARSQMDPAAPVYYFASSELWVNIVLITIVGLSVAVSFKPKSRFKNWYLYAASSGFAAFLILLGGLGVFYSNFRLDGWDLLLPLNYLMLLECGVVMAVATLTYNHPKRPVYVTNFIRQWVVAPVKVSALAALNGMKYAYQAAKTSSVITPTTQRRARA